MQPEISGKKASPIRRIQGSILAAENNDFLAIEEPLEIRLAFGSPQITKTISVTMRTPGNDFELAAGFLFSEKIIRSREEVKNISMCGSSGNVVKVELQADVPVDLKNVDRNSSFTNSSCGVCGKTSIEALGISAAQGSTLNHSFSISASLIHQLPSLLRNSQSLFATTGGIHASAIFSQKGELLCVREDVGRHNALDKVVGHALLNGLLPLSEKLLLVSGRASFELVQKAALAGIPVLAAVGAPSSLAVELARDWGMTLLGFVRENRFNIYCGEGIHHETQA